MDLHTTNTIVINGKTYNSVDEMPPEVRAQYESMSNLMADNNHNGTPDILENLVGSGATMLRSNVIVFQGKTYNNMDELPPEGRAAFEKAMGKLADDNHDGVPDILENALKNPQTILTTQTVSSPPRVVVQAGATSNMGPIIVLSIVAIGLAIVIVLLFALVLTKSGQ